MARLAGNDSASRSASPLKVPSKIQLSAGHRSIARRARRHLERAAENAAAHVGAGHLGSVDIGLAGQFGRGERRAHAIQRRVVQIHMHQHPAAVEFLERQEQIHIGRERALAPRPSRSRSPPSHRAA